MIFESMIVSIIIGFFRKGRLKNLENLSIKLWYLLSVAFLIQLVGMRVTQINEFLFYLMHLLSYVIIMYVCYVNRSYFSIKLIGIGNSLNFIVIALNEGRMPVKVPSYILNPYFDRGHVLMDSATAATFLGDLFVLEVPFFPLRVFSIGDVFLTLGVFLFIQFGMKLGKNVQVNDISETVNGEQSDSNCNNA